MDKVKLKDILVWLPKSSLKAGEGLENGKFPFFTSSQHISKFYNGIIYDDECLIFGTGGNPSIHYYKGAFATSTDCFVTKLKSLQNEINIKYAFYFLKANINILERGFKGVAIRHLSKTYLENIEINIPALEEQNRIVTLLDKVELIVDKRKQNISQLNTLIKSSFYRTFDSYIRNVRRYANFNDVITEIDTGWSPVCNNYARLTDNEVAVLKQSAVSKRFFDISENKALPLDKEIKKQCFIAKDDLLFSRKNTLDFVGASAYIFDDVKNLLMPDTVFNLRYSKEKVSGIYLYYLFNDINYRKNIRELATGALVSMSNISKQKLFELKLPVPNLELQLHFEKEARLVYEKLKIQYKSLDGIELLLKSLTQRLFSGQSQIDIDTELEAIINTINLELPDEENNINNVIKDMAYRQKLIDKLASRNFTDIHLYDKAKYIAFRMLKENKDKIAQEFDNKRKQVILN